MYANEQDGSATAFRQAEKRYQLHKEQQFSHRNGRRRSKGFVTRPVDLSEVVDLQPGIQHPGVTCLGVPLGMPPTAAAYAFAAHPGLLVVRGAMGAGLQRQLIMDALTLFPDPPNHTNHIKTYSEGLPGLWGAAQRGLRLRQQAAVAAAAGAGGITAQEAAQQQPKPPPPTQASQGVALVNGTSCHNHVSLEAAVGPDCGIMEGAASAGTQSSSSSSKSSSSSSSIWTCDGSGPSAESLLPRLRWATLGPPYDWTRRLYLREAAHMPLPAQLRQLAATLADLAAHLCSSGGRGSQHSGDAADCSGGGAAAAPCSDGGPPSGAAQLGGQQRQQQPQHQHQQAFFPDAALINYYYEGDTLNGHVDDAELCLSQPLVSLSLGCDAIFLMGTASKAEPPTPLLLRSGDAVVLSGQARGCYHGVPRILTDRPAAPDVWLGDAAGNGGDISHSGGGDGRGAGSGEGCVAAGFAPFARHMEGCRINISIRHTR